MLRRLTAVTGLIILLVILVWPAYEMRRLKASMSSFVESQESLNKNLVKLDAALGEYNRSQIEFNTALRRYEKHLHFPQSKQ